MSAFFGSGEVVTVPVVLLVGVVAVMVAGLSGMVSVPEKGKIPAGTETEIRCLQS